MPWDKKTKNSKNNNNTSSLNTLFAKNNLTLAPKRQSSNKVMIFGIKKK